MLWFIGCWLFEPACAVDYLLLNRIERFLADDRFMRFLYPEHRVLALIEALSFRHMVFPIGFLEQ
jgi:hypothetical protein